MKSEEKLKGLMESERLSPIIANTFQNSQRIFDKNKGEDYQSAHYENIFGIESKEKKIEYRMKMNSKTTSGMMFSKRGANGQHDEYELEGRKHDFSRSNSPQKSHTSKAVEQPNFDQPSKFQELMERLKAKRFFQQWRKFMPSHMKKVLNAWHYNLISDKTFYATEEKKGQYQKLHSILLKNKSYDEEYDFKELRTCEKEGRTHANVFSFLIQKIPLFSASGTFRLIWDIGQVINILAFQCFQPLYITFNVAFYEIVNPLIAYLMYFLMLCDILVNMNTSFYHKGKQVTNRKRVVLKYLKSEFTHDFLPFVLITVDMFIERFSSIIIRLFFLLSILKLKHMYSILSKIQDRFHLIRQINSYMQLFKLLIIHLLISHYFSCLWLIVGKSQNGFSWIIKREIENEDWPVQYINSYYFITLTMITVGYGDITPVTNIEIGLVIGIMTFACGVFAYSVTEIGSLIQDLRNDQKEIKNNLQTIQKYMHNKNISNELKFEIKEYLLYYWREESNKNGEKENIIINQLSDSLKETLFMEANHIVLNDSPVFRDNFSPEVLKKTVPLIKEFRCTPEEEIYCEGERDDASIYFIEKGSVEIYIDTSSGSTQQIKQLKQLKKGDNFGTICFFTGHHRHESIRSSEFTTLLMIKRDEFLNILKDHPEDYERFCFLRDKIMVQRDFESVGLRCYSCKSYFHQLNACPYLHFIPNKFKIIYSSNIGTNERKKDFQRISLFKYKQTLSMQQDIEQQVKIFLEENEDTIDYLYEDLESIFEVQQTLQDVPGSYKKLESMGTGLKDFQSQISQGGEFQEEDVGSQSIQAVRKGKMKNLSQLQQINVSQNQLRQKLADEIQAITNSPSFLAILPEQRKNERKGTISIQNHRNERQKLSKLIIKEKEDNQNDNNGNIKTIAKESFQNGNFNVLINQQVDQFQNYSFEVIETEVMKQFQFYFPKNNFDIVLNLISQKRQSSRYKPRQSRHDRKSLLKTKVEVLSSMNSLIFKYESQKDEQDKNIGHTCILNKSAFSNRNSRKRSSNNTSQWGDLSGVCGGDECKVQIQGIENLREESINSNFLDDPIHNQYDIQDKSSKQEEQLVQNVKIRSLILSYRSHFINEKEDELQNNEQVHESNSFQTDSQNSENTK